MPLVKTVKYVADTKEAEKGIKKLTAEEKKRLAQMKETEKEQKDLIDSMGVFGMTVGGLKQNFKGMKVAAGLAFKSIKAGLIATGIGAFVVALGSVAAYFTTTKKGAEQLEVALATVGSAFKVITDRFAKFGGAILKVFKGDFKGAGEDIKDTFVGIGEEIKNDIRLTNELAKASVKLRDSERDLRVETSQRRAEIEQLKLVAEDVTKSEDVRLAAAEKAFKIENDLLEKRIFNAEEAVRIQKEQMAISENMPEDLDKLAELEIALADIVGESTTKQIELNNKINAIKQEGINKEKEWRDANVETAVVLETTGQERVNVEDEIGKRMTAARKKNLKDLNKATKAAAALDLKTEELTGKQKLDIVANTMGQIASVFGQESKAGKALAIGQTLISTYTAAAAALKPPPEGAGPIWGIPVAAGAVLSGLMNVKKIKATKLPYGDSGGSGGGDASGSVPAMPSGIGGEGLIPNLEGIEATGLGEPQPVQAYVVENDISDAQALQQELDVQATL